MKSNLPTLYCRVLVAFVFCESLHKESFPATLVLFTPLAIHDSWCCCCCCRCCCPRFIQTFQVFHFVREKKFALVLDIFSNPNPEKEKRFWLWPHLDDRMDLKRSLAAFYIKIFPLWSLFSCFSLLLVVVMLVLLLSMAIWVDFFKYGPTPASFCVFLVAGHLQTMTVHTNNRMNISAL